MMEMFYIVQIDFYSEDDYKNADVVVGATTNSVKIEGVGCDLTQEDEAFLKYTATLAIDHYNEQPNPGEGYEGKTNFPNHEEVDSCVEKDEPYDWGNP